MKMPINDALVAECARRIRSGGPVGAVFPYPLSQCGFTEAQRLVIKEARKFRARLKRKSKPLPVALVQRPAKPVAVRPDPPSPQLSKPVVHKPPASAKPSAPRPQSLNKLERMLYLQQGKCFFCGEKLALADANVEHLLPLSMGGTRTEDNEVACHKSLNETFGNLPLKRKFEFALRSAGAFRCPKK